MSTLGRDLPCHRVPLSALRRTPPPVVRVLRRTGTPDDLLAAQLRVRLGIARTRRDVGP